MNNFNIPPANIGDLFLEAKRHRDNNTIQALQTAVQFEMEKRKARKQRELAGVIRKQLSESGVEVPEMETPEEVLAASEIPLQKMKAEETALNELKETKGNIGLAKALNLIDDATEKTLLSIIESGQGKIPAKNLGEIINTMLKNKLDKEKTKLMIGYWSARGSAKQQFPLSLLTQKMEMQPNPDADFLKRDLLKPIAISYSELLFSTPEFLTNRYWDALGYKEADRPKVLQKFREARQIAIGSLVNSLKMARPEQEEALRQILKQLEVEGGVGGEATGEQVRDNTDIDDEVSEFERFLFGAEQ